MDIDLPQVCAIVGPNNAGKSNILLALARVLGRDWLNVNTFSEEDVCGRDRNNDIRIQVTLDPAVQYHAFKEAEGVAIGALAFEYTRHKKGEKKGLRRLEQGCLGPDGKQVWVLSKAPKRGEKHDTKPLVGIPSEVRESIPLVFIGTNRSLKEQLPSARYSLLRQLLEDVDRDLHDPSRVVTVSNPDGTTTTMPRAERFLQAMKQAMGLLRTESFDQLERSIKRHALTHLGFDPEADADQLDFFFGPFESLDFYKALDLRVREGDFAISATELGEGVQNALVLAILRVFEERRKQGAIILIEEPEMFLHPQMQRSLSRTLQEIGKKNQVIYTTHSPHFVSVPDYNQVLLVRKDGDGTHVTQSSLPTSPQRREKLLKELDPERNELFFASRVLLVEGDTEKLAFPEYAKRFEVDLDRAGATIVEVGGKRNLPEFAAVASSFGIPTGIVYDEDSSDFQGKEAEETGFNASLDSFADGTAMKRVWAFSSDYEDHLRTGIGEAEYGRQCQKYPKTGKPTRARLIAMDPGLPVPEPVEEILRWLAGVPSAGPV